MVTTRILKVFQVVTCLVMVACVLSTMSFAATIIPNSVPPYLSKATNLGAEDPARVVNVTVRLALHNRAGRDLLLQQLYSRTSPMYHKWLTPDQYAARFAPTSQEAAQVQDFLKSQGLNIIATNKYNYTVTAQGQVSDVQKAFGVQINRYSFNGDIRYSNAGNPSVPTQLAGIISSIGGITEVRMKPHHVFAPDSIQSLGNQRPGSGGSQVYYEYQCYRGTESHGFSTSGHMPAALYSGNRYGADIHNGQGHLPPCGYEPLTLEAAYGLTPVYSGGLDGNGQTVVIVDAFGSPTAAPDIIKFSNTFSIPPANFTKYDPQGPPDYNSGWAGETTLDIEWAHAMAPGANIVLIETIDNFDNNLMGGIQYALDNQLGNVISNSYGSDEYDDDAADMQAWDDLNAEAATLGVSVNFSTGDDGDFYRDVGAYTVSVPSNSPHATAVGGVSVFRDQCSRQSSGLCCNLAARPVLLLWSGRRHEPVLCQTRLSERSPRYRTPAAGCLADSRSLYRRDHHLLLQQPRHLQRQRHRWDQRVLPDVLGRVGHRQPEEYAEDRPFRRPGGSVHVHAAGQRHTRHRAGFAAYSDEPGGQHLSRKRTADLRIAGCHCWS